MPKQKAQLYTRCKMLGLTLIELLVSMALGAVVIGGVFTLYMDASQTNRFSAGLAHVQEAGRIGLNFITKEIRMAGYQGCADPADVITNIIAITPPTTSFFTTAIRGFEVANSNWADGTEFDNTDIETRAVTGSDVIAIHRGIRTNITLSTDMASQTANISVSGSDVSDFSQNDFALISDCENADLFRITSNPTSNSWAHGNNLNSSDRLSRAYANNAQIMQYMASVYFVADTGRKDAQGQAIFALYRQTTDPGVVASFAIEELVEGVESMQILYGEMITSGNIRFVPANTPSLNMASVVSVRIGLLVSSAGSSQELDEEDYELPGITIQPEGATGATVTHPRDTRFRRTFIATSNIRNRP